MDMSKQKIAGITNDVTTCECCGRDDLKKTIVLMDTEGNIKYYGSNCAASALKSRASKSEIEKQAQIAQTEAAEFGRKTARLLALIEMKKNGAVVTEAGQNIIEVIAALMKVVN